MRAVYSSRSRDPRSGPFTLGQGLGPRDNFFWLPGGRLSLTSGTAVTTSDVTGAATVYYTEHSHAFLPLWNGKRFTPFELPLRPGTTARELALSVSGISSATVYDVFARLNGGKPELVLGPAWSSATARAAAGALARTAGRWTLLSDPHWLYLGTIYGSGSGTTEDSVSHRYLWNAYNRFPRSMVRQESTGSWAYASAAWRQANAAGANQLLYVQGLSEEPLTAQVYVPTVNSTNNRAFGVGIGVDSTTTNSAQSGGSQRSGDNSVGADSVGIASYVGWPGIGQHALNWLEYGNGSNQINFVGTGTAWQSALTGTVFA